MNDGMSDETTKHPSPRHLSEDRLVLHLLGDGDPSEDEHLASCDVCRAEQQDLRETLALVDGAPIPARDETYGAEVWRRIAPRIEAAGRPVWAAARREPVGWHAWWQGLMQPRGWAMAAAMSALLLVGFLAGRYWPVPSQPIPGAAKERILLVAVGDHLERAQMMLVELLNSDDVADTQQRAEQLVSDNRLYRQASAGAGDAATAALLDELERVLLDIAHRPSLTHDELEQVRRSIESKGILFRVKVIGSQVREREKTAAPARGDT